MYNKSHTLGHILCKQWFGSSIITNRQSNVKNIIYFIVKQRVSQIFSIIFKCNLYMTLSDISDTS